MTSLTDICFNFTHECFRDDGDEVIARARAAGVIHMVVPGVSLDASVAALELLKPHHDCLTIGAGTHPHLAHARTPACAHRLRDIASDPRVRFIGEIGLDYHRNYSTREQQQLAFEEQLEIAAELGLPVFLHQRAAHRDFVTRLAAARPYLPHAVVHCFTGNKKELHDYLDMDCHIGITGWICDERRGAHLPALIGSIPLSRLLLETDAPFLSPRDMRPKARRNEPCHLPHIARAVAACLRVPYDEVARHTHQNAHAFFVKPL